MVSCDHQMAEVHTSYLRRIDLSESDIGPNECEHFLKANQDRSMVHYKSKYKKVGVLPIRIV